MSSLIPNSPIYDTNDWIGNNISQGSFGYWAKKVVVEFLDLASFFLMALGIVLCIRFFIFSPFTVVGQSMEPTFHTDDFVIIDKVSSQKMKLNEWSMHPGSSNNIKSIVSDVANALPSISRGDIIVFVPPGKDIHYIKRVVGLPGETVSIKDDKVTICKTASSWCFVLDESYLPTNTKTATPCGLSSFIVENGLFVLGDNREHSTDSRCCFSIGCYGEEKWYIVPYDYVIWKVRARVIPEYTKY